MLTPKASSRLEWILGYYKFMLIASLGCAGIVLLLGLIFLLMVGSCVYKAADAIDKSKGTVISEADLAKERAEIARQFQSRSKLAPPSSFTPSYPSFAPPVVSAQDPAKTTQAYSQGVVEESLKRLDQERRKSYQGFPGAYDADKQPWKKSK